MNETTFTRMYMKNFERQIPCTWFKIPDPHSEFGYSETGTRFVDVVACVCGVFVGMEWKLNKKGRGLPINRVRSSQIKALKDIENTKGFGFLMVGEYVNKNEKCVYIIPIELWLLVVKRAEKKSIRLDKEFPEYRTEMVWQNGLKQWNTKIIVDKVIEFIEKKGIA